MHDDERRAVGSAMRRQTLGNAYVDRTAAAATPFSAELQDLMTRYVWSEIWTRDGLDARTRRVLVIGTLIAIGRWDELAMHVKSAVTEGGFTEETLKEIVLQQAVYCGVPVGHQALTVVQAAIQEIPDDQRQA